MWRPPSAWVTRIRSTGNIPNRSLPPSAFLFTLLLVISGMSISFPGYSQRFFVPADTFHQDRFWISTGIGTAAYGVVLVGLQQAWYAETEQTRFHTFNDWKEWRHMDKLGHVWTTYNETRWLTQGARWTGMNRSSSRWTGASVAFVLQTSVEVLDAFSSKWGFSWPDMAANTLGASSYLAQDIIWAEQRILFKISSNPVDYSSGPVEGQGQPGTITYRERADELYGNNFASRYLKDYNAMTIWMSINPASFTPVKPDWLPDWLNIAIGISGENLYGGFDNSWTTASNEIVTADPVRYPRITQYFLAPDIDLSRIRVRSPLVKTLLYGLNFIKIPAPALSFDSSGKWSGHWLYY